MDGADKGILVTAPAHRFGHRQLAYGLLENWIQQVFEWTAALLDAGMQPGALVGLETSQLTDLEAQ